MSKTKLSLRIDLPSGERFGPGKATLLVAIRDTGSIAAAARALEMSYPRALRLCDSMNTQFKSPLVEKHQGGAKRGGAILTPLGHEILALYTATSEAAHNANKTALKAFTARAVTSR